MNQRIQKLIEQATQSAMWPGDPDAGDLDAEKFAELIVRECSLFVFKQNGPKSALNLLEHFGVEE
jgi:hypothetical protein